MSKICVDFFLISTIAVAAANGAGFLTDGDRNDEFMITPVSEYLDITDLKNLRDSTKHQRNNEKGLQILEERIKASQTNFYASRLINDNQIIAYTYNLEQREMIRNPFVTIGRRGFFPFVHVQSTKVIPFTSARNLQLENFVVVYDTEDTYRKKFFVPTDGTLRMPRFAQPPPNDGAFDLIQVVRGNTIFTVHERRGATRGANSTAQMILYHFNENTNEWDNEALLQIPLIGRRPLHPIRRTPQLYYKLTSIVWTDPETNIEWLYIFSNAASYGGCGKYDTASTFQHFIYFECPFQLEGGSWTLTNSQSADVAGNTIFIALNSVPQFHASSMVVYYDLSPRGSGQWEFALFSPGDGTFQIKSTMVNFNKEYEVKAFSAITRTWSNWVRKANMWQAATNDVDVLLYLGTVITI